jgi:DNA-binding NtrC family response regulator
MSLSGTHWDPFSVSSWRKEWDVARKEVDSLMLLIPFDHATLPEVQRMFAQKVLDHVGGHKVKAAKILGVSRPRLNRILKNAEDGSED